jgi:hypothetical protein
VLRARAKLCKQRCARSVLGPCPNRRLRTSAVTGGPEEPQVGGPPRHAAGITRLGDSNLWSRRSEGGETPPSAASPPGSCQRCGGHLRRTLPSGRAGAVAARREDRCSCRPCHPRAISSGHERYLTDGHGHFEGRWGGRRSLTCGGGGGRNCMACKCSRSVP